jgi:type II secretory pathway pseudopilin PulG
MKGNYLKGYTILELMIVITVSATMFVSVAIAFGGRQQEVQFTQAVRDFDARLLDIINDVSTGYYNNSAGINCSVLGVDPLERPTVVGDATNAGSQGSSDNCIFIGKAIQFAPDDSAAPGNKKDSTIHVYNMLGKRTSDGSPSGTLEAARPKAVAPDANPDDKDLAGEVSIIELDWGLQVTDIKDGITPTANEYGVIGFFTSFAKTFSTGAQETAISNNQSVRYGAIPGTSIGQPAENAVNILNNITDNESAGAPDVYVNVTGRNSATINGNNFITICLKSADDSRRAAIVIGLDGTTSTQVQFDDYDRGLCVS